MLLPPSFSPCPRKRGILGGLRLATCPGHNLGTKDHFIYHFMVMLPTISWTEKGRGKWDRMGCPSTLFSFCTSFLSSFSNTENGRKRRRNRQKDRETAISLPPQPPSWMGWPCALCSSHHGTHFQIHSLVISFSL